MTTDTLTIDIRKTAESRLPQLDMNNLPFGKVFSDHMFSADYESGQWKNLQIVPYAPLTFSPSNMAIHYGQSIFEGMKAYKNSKNDILVFRAEQNWERLNKSAHRMCMPAIPEDIFMEGLRELLSLDRGWTPAKDGCALYIRPFMFATDEFIGMRPSETYKFMIFTCPVGKYYSEPVKLKIETHFSRAAQGGTGSAKCAGNYAASMYPAKMAQLEGYNQVIWTDGSEHKYVEEAGTMNLMFLINNVLITAATSDSILDGVTRKSVLTLAKEWNIKVEERKVTVTEIVEALKKGEVQEAFGVGTAATVAPVSNIGFEGTDYKLPEIKSDSLTNRILIALDDIKYDRVPDTRNWITRI